MGETYGFIEVAQTQRLMDLGECGKNEPVDIVCMEVYAFADLRKDHRINYKIDFVIKTDIAHIRNVLKIVSICCTTTGRGNRMPGDSPASGLRKPNRFQTEARRAVIVSCFAPI
uniref:Methyltransf_21 domain-containing protein n=1 Tax=Panagrellus redivivus TaxID=6233 RepID=A0A7E4VY57_PANRE